MIHKLIRKCLFFIHDKFFPAKASGETAQQCIEDLLMSEKPCMIARFGSVEIQGTLYGVFPSFINVVWEKRIFKYLINNAGFFPVTTASVKEFSRLMIDSMKQLDCLASWRIEEAFFQKELRAVKRISLDSFGPGNELNSYSWYKKLKGKKILVISPFAKLIEQQYETQRVYIWKNPNILPEYESLSTIKAINSVGGDCDFSSWFDALDHMKSEIDKVDFDIALLGCGAYGFPLAAYIKNIGKKAVHIGGATQLIFGIKGKRWENENFINDHWVSPRKEDRPKGFEKIEGGCYW